MYMHIVIVIVITHRSVTIVISILEYVLFVLLVVLSAVTQASGEGPEPAHQRAHQLHALRGGHRLRAALGYAL